MVVGGGWEEHEEDESVLCSMVMELYCSAADCLIAAFRKERVDFASEKGTGACRCSKYKQRSSGDTKTDLL